MGRSDNTILSGLKAERSLLIDKIRPRKLGDEMDLVIASCLKICATYNKVGYEPGPVSQVLYNCPNKYGLGEYNFIKPGSPDSL